MIERCIVLLFNIIAMQTRLMTSPDNTIFVKTHFIRSKGHRLSHRSVTLAESYKWENIYEGFPSRYLYFGHSFFCGG